VADTLDIAILSPAAKKATIALARYGSDIAIADLSSGNDLKSLLGFKDLISQVLLLNQKRPTKDELTKFGRALFRFLVRDEVKRLYDRLPLDTLVRINILTNRPDVQSLPWEFLQDPNQNPGPWLNRSVVRIIPTIGRLPPAPMQLAAQGAKLKILFVYAVPQDQTLVSWPSVKSRIESAIALSAAVSADSYELKVIQGTTEELFAAFQNQNDKYDIFQFSGHGDIDPHTGEGRILLVDSKKSDQSHPISASDLANILQGRGIRLAVLSACLTAAGTSADPFNVVAEALLHAGIPAVIANQLPVPDESIATFVGPLYAQLLNTGDIDLAVNDGRVKLSVVLAAPGLATLEWGIPTLYRYIDGQKVFQP
jgi:CHAT domain-containing protein